MLRTISVTGAAILFLIIFSLSGETFVLAEETNFTLQHAVEFARQNNGELKALREEKGVRRGR